MQVLFVLVVEALAEALAHAELVARPSRQVQAQHVGVLQRERQLRAHHPRQHLARAVGGGRRRAHALDELVDVVLEQAAQHGFLGREDLIEGAEGDLGGGRHLDHRRPLIALAGEQPPGGVQDLGPPQRALARPAADRRVPADVCTHVQVDPTSTSLYEERVKPLMFFCAFILVFVSNNHYNSLIYLFIK